MNEKETNQGNEDYGIGMSEMNNEIITELSPRSYLFEHGVSIQKSCQCQGCEDLGEYEIRFDPVVLLSMDPLDGFVINSEDKVRMMKRVYESIFTQNEYDFWAFEKAKIPARFSKKIDINADAQCENLENIKDVASEGIDLFTAIENGYVLRLFYSSADDCFADFKKIFGEMNPSIFRDSVIDYEFKDVNKVVIKEVHGHWVLNDEDCSGGEKEQD